MCIEFALKKGGIGILKNFMYSTKSIISSLSAESQRRFKVGFKVKNYTNGKSAKDQQFYIDSFKDDRL